MFGILLAGLSSGFAEVSDSIGKKQVGQGYASLYTFGFLNLFFGTIFLVFHGFLTGGFSFSPASLPTFLPRLALEILQAHLSVSAVIKADRSAYGFMRVLTIPILLTIDLSLGNIIGVHQLAGIALIAATIIIFASSEKFQVKGFWLLLAMAANAAVTISLYKYDITHFNSVDSEQTFALAAVSLYFFILAAYRANENPLRFLSKPAFFAQSVSSGLSSAVGAFAYLFSPATVITTAIRAFAVLTAIVSGNFYFREKKFILKIFLFCAITAGLILLAF